MYKYKKPYFIHRLISLANAWVFTTGDNALPTVVGYSPRAASTGVASNSSLVLLFNRNVVKGSMGEVSIRRVNDHTLFERLPISSARVTVADNQVTIAPTNALEDQTSYYVLVSPGSLVDLSGNNFGGVTAATTWTFTIADSYNYLQKWSVGNGPSSIVINANGMYVAEMGSHRVERITLTGNTEAIRGGPASGSTDGVFNSPQGIAVDAGGFVYVADTVNHRIQRLTAALVYDSQTGSFGTANGQFNAPAGIAIRGAFMYVADTGNNRIQKIGIPAPWTFSAKWGSGGTGNGQFSSPRDLAIDSAGNVYVADTGNNRIQKFDANGTYLAQWGSFGTGPGEFNLPRGIGIDAADRVYVADTNNHRIQVFDSNGTYLTRFGAFGNQTATVNANGLFNTPNDVAIDAQKNLVVAEGDNNRMQMLAPR